MHRAKFSKQREPFRQACPPGVNPVAVELARADTFLMLALKALNAFVCRERARVEGLRSSFAPLCPGSPWFTCWLWPKTRTHKCVFGVVLDAFVLLPPAEGILNRRKVLWHGGHRWLGGGSVEWG